jgi:transcription-repair coupling factor (superfamily II helicase)
MRDLDIRGAGNILGAEQSGFVTDIGYETYQKILEETLRELKNNEYKELYADTEPDDPVRDVNIDTDVEMLIPNNYVENSSERLAIYTELDNIETEAQLAAFTKKITDRFGKLPQPVYELFDGLRLRWICRKLGFERIILKNNKMRCYFPANPQSFYFSTPVFQKLLDHITKLRDPRIQMKQSNNLLQLIIDQVPSLKKAQSSLQEMFDRL